MGDNLNKKSKRRTIEQLKSSQREGTFITILSYAPDYKPPCGVSFAMVYCRCVCGKIIKLTVSRLKTSISCGCKNIEISKKANSKYSKRILPIYICYRNMMNRCYNKRLKLYKNYGGRGVSVCKEWKNNYENFLNWALPSGWEKGLHLDKDIKGNGLLYSPKNCCWVTRKENMNKTSRSVYYEYNGKKMTLSKICELNGLKYGRIYDRIRKLGMSLEDAIYDGKLDWHRNPKK